MLRHGPFHLALGLADRCGPGGRRRAFGSWTALSIALGLAAVGLAWHLRFVQDDAFISYAYARSLVEGNGLTWLGTRVEGYTNFLWVVWIALGLQLGVAPVAWSYLGGLAALAGTLAATIRCARSPSAPALLGAWVVNTLGFGEAIPDRLTLTLIPIDERQGLVAWYLNRTAELDALVATWPSVELRR